MARLAKSERVARRVADRRARAARHRQRLTGAADRRNPLARATATPATDGPMSACFVMVRRVRGATEAGRGPAATLGLPPTLA